MLFFCCVIIARVMIMAIFTEETKILELNNKIICTEENARNINIDYKTFQTAKYKNWYIANGGGVYYGKVLNDKEILNYLLCEKIAGKVYELQTAHFIPAKIRNKTGLASLNFRKRDVDYFYASQDYFPFDNPTQALRCLKNFFYISKRNEYYKLVDDILRLISFHIYTGLRDLIDCNLLFQEEENGFSLAPLYDFDFAFEHDIVEKYYYKSTLCFFALPSEDLNELLEYYPYFRNYLLFMLNINMKIFLEEIKKENNLEISELYQSYYLKQDKIKKDFVRSLHL